MLIADNATMGNFQALNKIRRILPFSFIINHLISIILLLSPATETFINSSK